MDETLEGGIARAAMSIDGGHARAALDRLVAITNTADAAA